MSSSTETAPLVRFAVPGDGRAISRLYDEAYTPEGASDASVSYPFPQFLDPTWVSQAVSRRQVCWIVATQDGEVIGTLGAVRNVGTERDAVAEFFGLVVSEPWRGRGVGNLLMTRLCELLAPHARFMIAETRTADPRGWLSARRSGFRPLGFEPFAHSTPAGLEPMLLLGRSDHRPGEEAVGPAPQSLHAHQLATVILAGSDLETTRKAPVSSAEPAYLAGLVHDLEVVRDDERGRKLLASLSDANRHASGVVNLERLQGEDPRGHRYAEAYFLGLLAGQPVACLHGSWDRCDRRARILSLCTSVPGAQPVLISRACEWLDRESNGEPLSAVIDVRADQPELLASLERGGFFPTLYYPGLIAGESGRIDALQYTRLFRQAFGDSLCSVHTLDWPEARNAVEAVADLARESARLEPQRTAAGPENAIRSPSSASVKRR